MVAKLFPALFHVCNRTTCRGFAIEDNLLAKGVMSLGLKLMLNKGQVFL